MNNKIEFNDDNRLIYCGWLTPKGDFIGIPFMHHYQYAENHKDLIKGYEPKNNYKNFDNLQIDDKFLYSGFIKLSYSAYHNYVMIFKKPTKSQMKWYNENLKYMHPKQIECFEKWLTRWKD